MKTVPHAPETALEVRSRLVDALRLDLVGPTGELGNPEERFRDFEMPGNWYLTGYLIPAGTAPERRSAGDEDGDDDADVPERAGLVEESAEERKAKKRSFLPSSMGVSLLVDARTTELTIEARWGDYGLTVVRDRDDKPAGAWQRTPRSGVVVAKLRGANGPQVLAVPGSHGLELHVVERSVDAERLAGYLPAGTRSVSVFLVNRREPVDEHPDTTYAFQAEIEVRCAEPLVARPDPRGLQAEDWDDQVADLHYADTPTFATGHGVSADWELVDGCCRRVWTTWIPSAEVEKTETAPLGPDLELSMDALGELADAAAVQRALGALTAEYRAWIEARERELEGLPAARRETAEALLHFARTAAQRIDRGVDALRSDPDALDAFRIANRAIARALRKRLGIDRPKWRAFQLAFVLLNLPGLSDPQDPHREIVDLLFFPTGGGKTEAYLGLAAFAMVLRRLRHPGDDGRAGGGVSVIMRYTLRLLTLDQLTRAAGLVCALELEREQDPRRYGSWPFEIGLWVGKAATPNNMGRKGDKRDDTARAKTRRYKAEPHRNPSPIPIEACPWCGAPFDHDCFSLLNARGEPDDDLPAQLRVVCSDFECEFSQRGLPVVAIDEPLFRRLPAFLISTVDKFASLPWVGASGALLGGADRFDATGYYGASETGLGRRLSQPLPPPDLVIQDELHLISGPLGTMAGLYETVIESLCVRGHDARALRPKIVASTATVRRAQEQIQALFGRSQTEVFPPPGPDRRDSFFARTVPASQTPARLYVGIAAQGRNPKVVMRRTWLALMGAAQRAYVDAGIDHPDNPADAYMTVLGYFNSLRELGGARRILEEEVQNTIQGYGGRQRLGEETRLFGDRKRFSEVVELTSRVSTDKVKAARARLEKSFRETDSLDCAIATNMISVGLDVPRLGLMVVFGQPKTTSEYIQATSRVGRSDKRPGLVVTLLNIHRPRDRSHYERFRGYHQSFYRSVEVASVTPFSARALDRGMAGALVTFARHMAPRLTPADGAMHIDDVRVELEQQLLRCFEERLQRQPFIDEDERDERRRSVQNRVVDLLDAWHAIVSENDRAAVKTQYQPYEPRSKKGTPHLLREMLERELSSELERKFRVNRSLRDVEPTVNLFLDDLPYVPRTGGRA